MTYLEAIEDALDRFPDMPVEMRQAFYTVLLVGDVTEEEAAASRDIYTSTTQCCTSRPHSCCPQPHPYTVTKPYTGNGQTHTTSC